MTVYFVTRGVPDKKYPLNGIFEFDQALALTKAGIDIVYLVLDFRSILRFRKLGFYKSKVKNINVFYTSIPFGNIEHPLLNHLARIILKFTCWLLKKNYKEPDIIHSHFLLISSLALEIKLYFNKPLVATEHSSLLNNESISDQLYKIAKKTYNNSDLLITVSNSLRKKIFNSFQIDSIVIPNIVNDQFITTRTYRNINEFIFISVGTLNHNKGFDLLIDAFNLASFPNNVYLEIIGEGEEKHNLLKKISDLNLVNQVKITGYKTRLNIHKRFLKSNVFVLASRSETFGVVFIEAIMSGLPVIATKCGGPEDIVNLSNGILVPINDINELKESLKFMYTNSNKYNTKLISEEVSLKFSPNSISSKLIDEYLKIIN
jgi:glycosyltransferase involved in cell wall biosynthesis